VPYIAQLEGQLPDEERVREIADRIVPILVERIKETGGPKPRIERPWT
jgi:hypothetical protein